MKGASPRVQQLAGGAVGRRSRNWVDGAGNRPAFRSPALEQSGARGRPWATTGFFFLGMTGQTGQNRSSGRRKARKPRKGHPPFWNGRACAARHKNCHRRIWDWKGPSGTGTSNARSSTALWGRRKKRLEMKTGCVTARLRKNAAISPTGRGETASTQEDGRSRLDHREPTPEGAGDMLHGDDPKRRPRERTRCRDANQGSSSTYFAGTC